MSVDVEKADFFFFDFWVLIPWLEAFTIQKYQIKVEIPKISLETKFQLIIFKTVNSTFFSRTTHFFSILKTSIGHFSNSHFQNFDFRFKFLESIRSQFKISGNLFKTAILRDKMAIFRHTVCHVTRISAYLLDCLVCYLYISQ